MQDQKAESRMPVVFVGHGSPMNAIQDTPWSRGFAELARKLPQPRAIVAISAHWYVRGTFVTGDANPRTIHDFGGFPKALYEITYPAPGNVDLAKQVATILRDFDAGLSTDWGIDHGTWSVLVHMYPGAAIPTIQLSIDRRLAVKDHLALARSLAPLRDQGVLILASGNVTHNLRDFFGRMRRGDTTTPAWARRFDADATAIIEQRDDRRLLGLWPDSDDGRMAHPSGDHYLPLIYAYGASDRQDALSCPITGFDAGSLSMRSLIFDPGA